MIRTLPPSSSIRFASLLLASLAVGCASWTDRGSEDGTASGLPALKQNPTSLVVNVEFVPIDIESIEPDDMQSLWQWVDETAIDPSKRRAWLINGLRAGRVLHTERFRARLDSVTSKKNAVDQFLAEAEVASDVSHGGKRIPMRIGRRCELPLRLPVSGSDVTLVRLAGETVGRTLEKPQYLFAVTPRATDSPLQIQLRLRPEVQHGSMRQQWISSDTALRIDRRREAWSLEELDLDLIAGEGDLFVISGTAPRLGLGKQMLSGNRADHIEQQVVVLIHVTQIPTPTSKL